MSELPPPESPLPPESLKIGDSVVAFDGRGDAVLLEVLEIVSGIAVGVGKNFAAPLWPEEEGADWVRSDTVDSHAVKALLAVQALGAR